MQQISERRTPGLGRAPGGGGGGALYGYCRWRLGYWRRRGCPRCRARTGCWHYGAGLLLRAPPAWLLARLYRAAPDQPLVGFYICHKPCLLLRDPLLVKRVLVTDFDAFADRNFAGEQQKDSFGMINLFGLRGPAWRYVRRRMAPALSASRMRAAVPAMLAATPRCWRGWRARRPRVAPPTRRSWVTATPPTSSRAWRSARVRTPSPNPTPTRTTWNPTIMANRGTR
ncbi:hypothetical protein MSG28_013849 [Choristoneura fumiferana]|uniref:Uncharacterized protein n=1 Tax=Choristoneura fumiferana TaxID=7141 RepID=A0ACC0KAA8_CHOFU|nr:hypothetical protein MSG28_013849 [Choristoneura fumiferana]